MEKTGTGVFNPRGVGFRPFLRRRLSESVEATATYYENTAQVDVIVTNKPGTDRANPLRIFLGSHDGDKFDPESDQLEEYEQYEGWEKFLGEVRILLPLADVLEG